MRVYGRCRGRSPPTPSERSRRRAGSPCAPCTTGTRSGCSRPPSAPATATAATAPPRSRGSTGSSRCAGSGSRSRRSRRRWSARAPGCAAAVRAHLRARGGAARRDLGAARPARPHPGRARLRDGPSTDEIIETIEVMTMHEQYYTPEQLEQLAARREALGEEGMQKAQDDWARLIAEVEAERERGTDPADPKVQALLERWQALIQAFTGGDPGITASLKRMYSRRAPSRPRAARCRPACRSTSGGRWPRAGLDKPRPPPYGLSRKPVWRWVRAAQATREPGRRVRPPARRAGDPGRAAVHPRRARQLAGRPVRQRLGVPRLPRRARRRLPADRARLPGALRPHDGLDRAAAARRRRPRARRRGRARRLAAAAQPRRTGRSTCRSTRSRPRSRS